ncbi:Trk family potassium uptake protein [Cohnella endophytica]|uniref:Trk family potassium uptake protein n=1 Tax=Cohnella endophytica TaxID=2419778 RepID=A0A494Y076_9BACL|nr:TrkH family potassium uptake protein [Cohnella endophytica]RKP56166.1 Trk family potassium uptake protein [Cohnella endophytica]
MFKKAVRWLNASPPRILLSGFALIILFGAELLRLPIASVSGSSMSFVDALFTATSATCVTGLVVLDTGTYFTTFGHWVILLLIQIGGIGFMTMATLFALILRRRISLKERLVLQESLNQGSIEGLVRLVRKVVFYALAVETVGALLYTFRFAADMSLGKAIYHGVFHSISIFNNAGFDLTGDFQSFFNYSEDIYMNVVSMGLIIVGGFGFVVLADLFDFRRRNKFSLHTRVVLSVSAGLIVIGTLVIFIFEFTNNRSIGSDGFGHKLLVSLFQSVTTRSGGVATVDVSEFRQATQFFMIILMFIGASPGSTGGGIKTTTFAVLVGAVFAMIRGKEDVVLFRHRLAQERVYKAVTVTLFCIGIVMLGTMLLATTEDAAFLKILFEVTSAFGTVGLSMGLTGDLTFAGKCTIIMLMFIGRLGPLTLTYALGPKPGRVLYRHSEGKIIIG